MKIFVSYKYWDFDVKRLPGYSMTYPHVRDYVDYIEDRITTKTNDIYKGEHDDEDLSDKTENYIWEKIKNKIYDSSLTIVLISPKMKDDYKWERNQWIPWEISYSLRETPRNDRCSHSNAILGVVLPDENGSYDYYKTIKLFGILKENIDNGYIPVTEWEDFSKYYRSWIMKAQEQKEKTPKYKIRVST